MIHPNLLSASAHLPLTESQKQVWKTAIRNQPSKVSAYRRTPIEHYNILKINELAFYVKILKPRNVFVYIAAFVVMGVYWRFEDWGIVPMGALIYLIQQHFFTKKNVWNLRCTTTGLAIPFHDEHNSLIEIPFQQIICIDFEKYYDTEGRPLTELVIYYAHHNSGYLTQRVAIVGNEADTIGIIHYFLNQYQNALPQKP